MDATVNAAFEFHEILEIDHGKYASGIQAIVGPQPPR